MISMRAGILGAMIALLASGMAGSYGAAMAADAARGSILYETRCKACHEHSVHNRDMRKVKTFAALRTQVLRWSAESGGVWTAGEIDDVALYLNERYYRLPCPRILCKAEQALITR